MSRQRNPFSVSFWTGDCAKVTRLRAGKDFHFDLDAVNSFCLGDLPRRLVDFLRIGSALYVVDRLVKRRSKSGPRKSARTIGLKVGVLEHMFWNSPDVKDCIHRAVEFVSDDFWNIEFERDTQPFKPGKRLFTYTDESPPLICPYSGGLDSAAGLATRMDENPERPVIPVTVWHQPRQRHLVRQQFDLLRYHYRSQGRIVQVHPLVMKVAMNWQPSGAKRREERSQRCRAFLFPALGATAAIMNRQCRVEMFESGIGAINLPLMAGMVGSRTTKNAHPAFLRSMSRLASLVSESDVEFCLPFFGKTKGEVVSNLTETGLERLANLSASCVHYPRPGSKYTHCGVCPGCIGRRQAMAVAGVIEPDDLYEHDFLGSPEQVSRILVQRLDYLKAFLLQVAKLRDIERTLRLPAEFERHVVGTGIVPRGQSLKGVIRLLATYRDEWREFISLAVANGHAWAMLLAPNRPEGATHASA